MIQRKLNPCKKCGKPSYIFSHGLCRFCAGAEANKKKQMKNKSITDKDNLLYTKIWSERKLVCAECGKSLTAFSNKDQFHHILPKSKYPYFRHDERNIILLCGKFGCHSKAESAVEYPKMKIYNHCESIKKELLATVGIDYFPLWRRNDYNGIMVWERDNPIIQEEKY